MNNKIALGLHALAHDIATGLRPIGMRSYTPDEASGLSTTRVIPDAVHAILCPSQATLLYDANENLIICDACRFAVDLEHAA